MKKLLIALLMVPAMAHAEFWTGNKLYERLTSAETTDRIQAMGYVMGVYDVAVHALFCPPGSETNITVGQIRDMASNWLANNPHRRSESAEKLVIEAFRQVWPCRNRGGTRL
jgi:hypothetical protein